VSTTRTFESELDDATAIARLDAYAEDTRQDAAAAGVRIRRLGPRLLSFYLNEPATRIEAAYVISLTPSERGTTVTAEIEAVRWRGHRAPFGRRLQRALADSVRDDLANWFAPDGPPDPARGEHPVMEDRFEHDQVVSELRAVAAAPRALDAPGIERVVRRQSLIARLILLVAVASTALGVVSMNVESRLEDRIRRDGIKVDGTVLAVPGDGTDDLVVEYDAEGRTYRVRYPAPEHDYRVGQTVHLQAIPSEGRELIGDEIFDNEWTSDAVGFGFLVALIAWPAWIARSRLTLGVRRRLRASPFRPIPVRRARLSKTLRIAILEVEAPTGPRPVRVSIGMIAARRGSPWFAIRTTGLMLAAGRPCRERSAYVAPGTLGRVTWSRLPLRRRWWAWWLGRNSFATEPIELDTRPRMNDTP
jgi:hypothetical protein